MRQLLAAFENGLLPPERSEKSDEIDELMATVKAESDTHAGR
jgi:hypothetical protein